jgi:RNA polymerase sigma-70 factor (ECF subfamily)
MRELALNLEKTVAQPVPRTLNPADESLTLTSRARRGETEALRLIFERYSRPVFGFVYDMLGERAHAEDVVQETFVRAYGQLGRLRDDTKLASWLFGIARNVALESLRKHRRESRHVELDEYLERESSDEQSPHEEELLGRELNKVIHEALDQLTNDQRLVFTMKIFQKRKYEEISEITGHSVSKLKSDLFRARIELRDRLRSYLEEGAR